MQVFRDAAFSGASALRPGYQALMEGGRNGAFDIVVAEALDRLSRDQEDIAAPFKRLRFAGIRIVTLAEGEISELHVGLKGTMNALFLRDMAAKVHRGLRGRVEAGRSGGGNAYGYSVVRRLDPSGQPVTGERQIDAAQAAIVDRIFQAYAAPVSEADRPELECRRVSAGHAAARGVRVPSMAIVPEAPVFSTTNSTSAAFAGTGLPISRTRRADAAARVHAQKVSRWSLRFPSCALSINRSGMPPRRAKRRWISEGLAETMMRVPPPSGPSSGHVISSRVSCGAGSAAVDFPKSANSILAVQRRGTKALPLAPISAPSGAVNWRPSSLWRPGRQTQKAPRIVALWMCKSRWLRGQDLNLRPSGYEPDELPGCSTPRHPSGALAGPGGPA